MWRILPPVLSVLLAFPALAQNVETEEIIGKLAKIQIDKSQIYSIRDITIRRDVLSISLNRGTIAFTEAVAGRVTGAVFIGSGDILAIPPDAVEKQQLHRYTGSALLNEHFETAVFRFTDGTHEEFLKQYQTHAQEDVDADEMSEILRWNAELERRGRFLDARILADLIGSSSSPMFLAQLEGAQLGWFDAVYDERRSEEIVIEQNVVGVKEPVVWASFHKRGEAREAARAHEDKSVVELVSYAVDGTTASLKLRWKVDGERVVEFPVSSSAKIASVAAADGKELPFVESSGYASVITPERGKRGDEISFRITYLTDAPRESGFRTIRAGTMTPASYRDQWIIEGLARYSLALPKDSLNAARLQLLQESPEGDPYEKLGSVSIGFRLSQPGTTEGYLTTLRNKSLWIMHMLRVLMRDAAFTELIAELRDQFNGKAISTLEFQKLAEKHAGRELDWFFEQWVFGTGIPKYHVDYRIEAAPGGFAVVGRVEQSGVPDSFTMPVPLYADETLLGRVTVSADEGEFRFVAKNRPQLVQIDPEGTILAVIE